MSKPTQSTTQSFDTLLQYLISNGEVVFRKGKILHRCKVAVGQKRAFEEIEITENHLKALGSDQFSAYESVTQNYPGASAETKIAFQEWLESATQLDSKVNITLDEFIKLQLATALKAVLGQANNSGQSILNSISEINGLAESMSNQTVNPISIDALKNDFLQLLREGKEAFSLENSSKRIANLVTAKVIEGVAIPAIIAAANATYSYLSQSASSPDSSPNQNSLLPVQVAVNAMALTAGVYLALSSARVSYATQANNAAVSVGNVATQMAGSLASVVSSVARVAASTLSNRFATEGTRGVNPTTIGNELGSEEFFDTEYGLDVGQEQQSFLPGTVGNFLAELAGGSGVRYGMLLFGAGAALASPPTMVAGLATSLFRGVEGAKTSGVKGKGSETTVFCGPEMDCEVLRKTAEMEGVNLIEVDQKQPFNAVAKKTSRVIILGHGYISGAMYLAENKGKKYSIQPDDFAATFFPNAKIIHASACNIGATPKENFGKKNSLIPGQILFLHAGEFSQEGGVILGLLKNLISNKNTLPPYVPLQIIFKYAKDKTDIFESNTTTLDDSIIKILSEKLSSENKKFSDIYYAIIKHSSQILEGIVSKFSAHKQAFESIKSELSTIGYPAPEIINEAEKRKAVTDYLGQILIQAIASDGKSDLINKVIELGIGDVLKYRSFDSLVTPLFAATFRSHEEVVRNITSALEGKELVAAIIQKIKNGATPLYIASQSGHEKIVEAFLKIITTSNLEEKELIAAISQPASNGATTLCAAAQNGHKEVVKILIEAIKTSGLKGEKLVAAINKQRNDGITPLYVAVYNGNKFIEAKASGLKGEKLVAAGGNQGNLDAAILLARNGVNPEAEISIVNDGKEISLKTAISLTKDKKFLEKLTEAYAEYKESQLDPKPGVPNNTAGNPSGEGVGNKSEVVRNDL